VKGNQQQIDVAADLQVCQEKSPLWESWEVGKMDVVSSYLSNRQKGIAGKLGALPWRQTSRSARKTVHSGQFGERPKRTFCTSCRLDR
jgi:hypothetical protein